MTERLRNLAHTLKMGATPVISWPQLGEELSDYLNEHDDCGGQSDDQGDYVGPAATSDDEAELERVREILVDYGALDPGDTTTGICDLLDVLLPPRGA